MALGEDPKPRGMELEERQPCAGRSTEGPREELGPGRRVGRNYTRGPGGSRGGLDERVDEEPSVLNGVEGQLQSQLGPYDGGRDVCKEVVQRREHGERDDSGGRLAYLKTDGGGQEGDTRKIQWSLDTRRRFEAEEGWKKVERRQQGSASR